MTYNIHPIFVHFPVALLFVYSIIKILPLKKWIPSVAWRDVERVFLLVGVLGAFVALQTGEIAEHLVRANRDLVEMHSTFANISTWIYGILLAGEIFDVLNTYAVPKSNSEKLKYYFSSVKGILTKFAIPKTFASLGFIAISATGMLGGVIAYGVSADPLAPILLKILGIN